MYNVFYFILEGEEMSLEFGTPIVHTFSEKEITDTAKKIFDKIMLKILGRERIIQYCLNTELEELRDIAQFLRCGNRNVKIPTGMKGKEHAFQLVKELDVRELWRDIEVAGCEISIDVVGYFKGREKPFTKLMIDGSTTKVHLRGLKAFEAKLGPTLNGAYAERALFQIKQMGLFCSPQNVNLYISNDTVIEPDLYREFTKRGETILVSDLNSKDIENRIYELPVLYREKRDKNKRTNINERRPENLSIDVLNSLEQYQRREDFGLSVL